MTRLNPHADAAFDAIDTGLIILDGKRLVVAWNGWMEAASGISVGAASGKSLEEIFPDRLSTRLDTAIGQALELGASSIITHALHAAQFPLRSRAGLPLVHNVSIRPIGERPDLCCMLQITDVTDMVARERLLRERQNARYDAVVGSAPDAILTLDSDGVIHLANPAAEREFGHSAKDLVGRHLASLMQDAEIWNAAFAKILDGARLHRPVEIVARRHDGLTSHLEASAARWQSGGPVFVTAILRDVNERRNAVEALRQLNQTLEQRVAQSTADRTRMWTLSTDVMVVAGPTGKISSVNPAWTVLLGWSDAELVGSSLGGFVASDDRVRFESEMPSVFEAGTRRLVEVRMRTRSGATRTIEWSAVAADGVLQAVGRDVTVEREAEIALKNAEEALRHSQKMEAIGQLTGGIAHDFNNILTAIMGSMEVLKRRIRAGRLDGVEVFMDGAITSANRAAALTHRLLAFARRQPLDPKAVDVNLLIYGMDDLLRRTLTETVRVKTELEPGLSLALTDAHQLENAILNLVINARDAMAAGGTLTIATSTEVIRERRHIGQDELDPGSYVVVAVRDTGVGMPPDVIARVFEPFFTTKPIGQGTGLGLSMIYGFAKQSRGSVTVESTPGEGTVFRLYLPSYKGDVIAEATESPRKVVPGSGETVLVVEDDAAVRLIISDVLRELGYSCIEVGDGQAALPMLTSNAPVDLLITDVGLPGLNGRQLADIARRYRPSIKILFVTGYAEHATGHVPFLAPGMEMVTKPFTLDALALRVREMLTKKSNSLP